MGVPGFFPWLMKAAPNAILNSIPEGINTLMVDGNGELHMGYTDHFKLIKDKESKKSYNARFATNCNNFADYFQRRMTGLMATFKPQQEFYLAIDGVCPMAKMNQQKSRRYMSESRPEEFSQRTNYCDKNAITPGTKFMHEIHARLISFFQDKVNYFPQIMRYSSYLEYGEAEHKIFDRLRTGEYRYRRTVIYADDADVIINALIMPVESLFIARSKQMTLIDIAEARRAITELMCHSDGSTNPFCLFDFVFLTLFLGNDFLPPTMMLTNPFSYESRSIPQLNTMPFALPNYDGSLNFILEVYRRANINLISENYVVNFNELYRLIEQLTLFENTMISFNLNNGILSRKLAEKSFISGKCRIWGLDPAVRYPFEYQNLAGDEDMVIALFSRTNPTEPYRDNMPIRALYYNSIFSMYSSNALNAFADRLVELAACDGGPYPGKIHGMANNYLIAMMWVYYYYVSGINAIPNCDYYYQYPIAPMMRDIQDIMSFRDDLPNLMRRSLSKTSEFTTRKYKPYHHALSVLPLWSREAVPESVTKIMSVTGQLADLYPAKFIVFYQNMQKLDQKLALLPKINVDRMLSFAFPDVVWMYQIPRFESIRANLTYEFDLYASNIYGMIQQRRYVERKEIESKPVSVGIIRRW